LYYTVQRIYSKYPELLGADHIFCRLRVEKVAGEWEFIDDDMGGEWIEKYRFYGEEHFHDDDPCYSSPTWTEVEDGEETVPGMIAVGNNDGRIHFFHWDDFSTVPGDLRNYYNLPLEENANSTVLYSTAAYGSDEECLYIGTDEYNYDVEDGFTCALVRIQLSIVGTPYTYVCATVEEREELDYRYISSPALLPTYDPYPGATEYAFVLTTDMADPEEQQCGGFPGMDTKLYMIETPTTNMAVADSHHENTDNNVFDGIPDSVICTKEEVYVGIGHKMFKGDIGNDVISSWTEFAQIEDGTFCASPAIFDYDTPVGGGYRLLEFGTNGRIYRWEE
jgi:hypothetical protein